MELSRPNQTMTSLQIAELVGKPHSDLLKSIREQEVAWVKIGQGNFSQSSYKNLQNRDMPMYELNRSQCLYIATKFNDEARAKLIIRWEELENIQPKIPTTFSEALKLASEQAEQIEQQQLLISQQTPKVIAFENIIDSANTYTLDSVSDILNIGRTTLCKLLEEKKWKTIKETHVTSSTRYAEENGYAKTIYEYVKIGKNEIKTKRFVLKKKGLDKLLIEKQSA